MTIQCSFLDVGQGNAQIILLGRRHAIVIDTGPAYKNNDLNICLRILLEQQIQWIDALILTHDHDDHTGGAREILQEFRGRINSIYFTDGDNYDFLKDFKPIVYPLLKDSISNTICKRLSAPGIIYKNDTSSIELLYPASKDFKRSQEISDYNYAAGILLLTHFNHKILFTSDAPYSAFEKIYSERGVLQVSFITVPHHGGDINATPEQLHTLYSSFINSAYAVISVGTLNSYKHPKVDVVKAISEQGIELFCTQITSLCCPNCYLETWRSERGNLGLNNSLSTMKLDRGHSNNQTSSRNIACSGTIIVTITSHDILIENLDLLRENKCKLLSICKSESLPCYVQNEQAIS